jgi:hypothetical protein
MSGSVSRKLALLGAAALLALAAIGPAGVSAAVGTVWTTQQSCAVPDVDQNTNSYMVYETVYIRGKNFDPSTQYAWSITDLPSTVVASGNVTSDGTGYFCLAAWVVQPSAEGEQHQADVDGKHDNFGVSGTAATPTPAPPTATPTGAAAGSTLPPTDKISGTSSTSDSLGLVLMALAGVLASVLVLTPARARRR